jgi:outer membrane protein, heavy metal efflux system
MHDIAIRRCAIFATALLSCPALALAEVPPIPRGDEPLVVEADAGDRLPPIPASIPDERALEAPEPVGVLRLEDALAAALLRNPDLAAQAYEVRAREAATLQAGARPNPDVTLELEDFFGSGPYRGAATSQTTLLLGQRIELGGKRAARLARTRTSRDLAAWDYELRRIDVLARVAGAFVDVLAAEARRRLADENLTLAESMREVASRRMRAGIASAAEEIRATVAVDVATVEREHAQHELETVRQVLAAQWAGERPRFERAEGDLERLPRVPSSSELDGRIESSPSLARWQTEVAERKRQRDPDHERRLVGTREAARVRSVTEVATARLALEAASEEAALLRSRVLPGTERAVAALRDGYRQGRFALIEVLDAERTRLAARLQYLAVLREAHHRAHEIERLTGVPLEVAP